MRLRCNTALRDARSGKLGSNRQRERERYIVNASPLYSVGERFMTEHDVSFTFRHRICRDNTFYVIRYSYTSYY